MNFKKKIKSFLKRSFLLHRLYRTLSPGFRAMKIPRIYPTDLNLEITSVCNARCSFCSHQALTESGLKPARHMEYEAAREAIDLMKALTVEQGIAGREISFAPVGLGEPLLHPRFFEIVSYARSVFPQAFIHANSNCLALKGRIAERLAGSAVDRIILSVCFNSASAYKEQIGTDSYREVIENVKKFLCLKGDRSPAVAIHIFDLPVNRRNFAGFHRELEPYLNSNDFILLYDYLPDLANWTDKPGRKAPCQQLWKVLMVDVEGFVFPCCLGVWTKKDQELCLGHITDGARSLLQRAEDVRARHLRGDYRGCNSCAYLGRSRRDNRRFQKGILRKGKVSGASSGPS